MDRIRLHLEAATGASGDMLLGAFVDLGVPVEIISEAWTALGINNYEVEFFQTRKCGLKALQCRVKTDEKKGPRTWKKYERILKQSELPVDIRETSLRLCRRLFEVEGLLHGQTLSKLQLHEMGGTDLLIDVVGTLAAVEYLQPAFITASPVNTGRGLIRFSHGVYPVPAPATSKLLEGIPVFQNEVEGELTTPTGALLIGHLAEAFGPMPPMILQNTGCGAGERDTSPYPNVLRIFQGTTDELATDEQDVYMIESNIDDSNPQILSYFMEKAFEKGALDVFFTPIFMKKNRPAIRLSILTPREPMQELILLLFSETTAIGLRYWRVERKKLDRRWKTVKLSKIPIRIKEGYMNGTLYNYLPEFEDCKAAAAKLKKPVKDIMAAAINAYLGKK